MCKCLINENFPSAGSSPFGRLSVHGKKNDRQEGKDICWSNYEAYLEESCQRLNLASCVGQSVTQRHCLRHSGCQAVASPAALPGLGGHRGRAPSGNGRNVKSADSLGVGGLQPQCVGAKTTWAQRGAVFLKTPHESFFHFLSLVCVYPSTHSSIQWTAYS